MLFPYTALLQEIERIWILHRKLRNSLPSQIAPLITNIQNDAITFCLNFYPFRRFVIEGRQISLVLAAQNQFLPAVKSHRPQILLRHASLRLRSARKKEDM